MQFKIRFQRLTTVLCLRATVQWPMSYRVDSNSNVAVIGNGLDGDPLLTTLGQLV
jgi:hypothetical protein